MDCRVSAWHTANPNGSEGWDAFRKSLEREPRGSQISAQILVSYPLSQVDGLG
ncbi:uncharacterized protein MELLADRAFT_95732 [Melampsora larici-populina 98AG31]|uniref:Uncharacterized protein n=1 Tax=Melampsora larici-populina (strain 98AG31 / pathotype 3-4-7) TaxID=747676 RepID=F4SAE7_MELLP|nr:uncharacterized protein MELLADRAFT_95732 [Melampsora larici-populina 98AG31]EGF98373.1 hypothetical protein MELLADRAFT_95732 [Melampsora larici-populina 98AG31]